MLFSRQRTVYHQILHPRRIVSGRNLRYLFINLFLEDSLPWECKWCTLYSSSLVASIVQHASFNYHFARRPPGLYILGSEHFQWEDRTLSRACSLLSFPLTFHVIFPQLPLLSYLLMIFFFTFIVSPKQCTLSISLLMYGLFYIFPSIPLSSSTQPIILLHQI